MSCKFLKILGRSATLVSTMSPAVSLPITESSSRGKRGNVVVGAGGARGEREWEWASERAARYQIDVMPINGSFRKM
jgi:hypothetical protein